MQAAAALRGGQSGISGQGARKQAQRDREHREKYQVLSIRGDHREIAAG